MVKKEEEIKLSGMWAWVVLIGMFGILIMIILFSPKYNYEETQFDFDKDVVMNMSCDMALTRFEQCVNATTTIDCSGIFGQKMSECYGMDLILDQQALINSS